MSEKKEQNGNQSEKEGSGRFPTLSRIDSVGAIGTQIGYYRPLSVSGEGGFGIVYRAERKEPVRRQVAMKVFVGLEIGLVVRLPFGVRSRTLVSNAHSAKYLQTALSGLHPIQKGRATSAQRNRPCVMPQRRHGHGPPHPF